MRLGRGRKVKEYFAVQNGNTPEDIFQLLFSYILSSPTQGPSIAIMLLY